MRRVVHFGPANSPGGMATVIKTLNRNPPEGWEAGIIPTHGSSLLGTIKSWVFAMRRLKLAISKGEIDIAHIHVTHSISWIRKRSLMKICEKMGVPTVIHIHSGKFDRFCSGWFGSSVKKELRVEKRTTVVLEERWKGLLRKWIPDSSFVVFNPSNAIGDRKNHKLGDKVRLLLLSRKNEIKGHDFSIGIIEELHRMGINASLTMTGTTSGSSKKFPDLEVNCLGWVSEEEKKELVEEADFLISPSEYEGSSMSVIEAMVSGLPCIVSEASRETVGVSELVAGKNTESWAKAIIRCSNSEKYDDLLEKIRLRSSIYSIERCRSSLGEIYESLIV